MLAMAKNLCLECREVYDTKNNTSDQDKMGDEFFCSACWKKLKVGTAT